MELTLEHLAPYLPYGLEFINTQKLTTHSITGMSKEGNWDDVIFQSGNTKYYGWMYKPILRPLSDLTKEIEHNGEKIYPIIELGATSFPKPMKGVYGIIENYLSMGQGYSLHFNEKDNSFECRRGYDGKTWDYNCFVPKQLEMFNKLFEWHFDTFGLIEAGLAVDINTIG